MKQLRIPDWASQIENYLEGVGPSKAALQNAIRHIEQIWIGVDASFVSMRDQRQRVSDKLNSLSQMYQLRFGEQPPSVSEEADAQFVLLDNPEARRDAIREASLAVSQPGTNISPSDVLVHMTQNGQRIAAANPIATIATILYQFDAEFERVRRGVFKRKEGRVEPPPA